MTPVLLAAPVRLLPELSALSAVCFFQVAAEQERPASAAVAEWEFHRLLLLRRLHRAGEF